MFLVPMFGFKVISVTSTFLLIRANSVFDSETQFSPDFY